MIDPNNVPPVADDEHVARFVLSSRHVSHGKVTEDAFIPRPYQELSVTRLLSATEQDIWSVGKAVAAGRSRTLYGRGDIAVAVCLVQKLEAMADPVAENPNHAVLRGWPPGKPEQKTIALELAAAANYVALEEAAS